MDQAKKSNGFTFFNKKETSTTKTLNKLLSPSDESDTFNKIRFWEVVDTDTCEGLIDNIKMVEDKLSGLERNYNLSFDQLPPIEIHINSGGGSVIDALAVVDYIKSSKYKFVSIIEGHAASAATFISCVCDERYITEHGMILIHQLSSGIIGKMSELVDEINTCHKLMNIIIKMYREYTNIDINSIKKILTRDIFWNAEEALKFGIVDKIIYSNKQPRRKNVKNNYVISQKELEKGTLHIKRTRNENDKTLSFLTGCQDDTSASTESDSDSESEAEVEPEQKPNNKKRRRTK